MWEICLIYFIFKLIINLSVVAEVQELSDPEFTDHADSAGISASSFQYFQVCLKTK